MEHNSAQISMPILEPIDVAISSWNLARSLVQILGEYQAVYRFVSVLVSDFSADADLRSNSWTKFLAYISRISARMLERISGRISE